jgi:hypothetical protein
MEIDLNTALIRYDYMKGEQQFYVNGLDTGRRVLGGTKGAFTIG